MCYSSTSPASLRASPQWVSDFENPATCSQVSSRSNAKLRVNRAAAVSTQATYNSCFCQSAYLVPLNGPNAQTICPACAASDTTALQSWFSGFCKQGAVAGGANANGQPTTSTSSTSTKTNVPTATGAGTNAKGGAQPSTEHKSW